MPQPTPTSAETSTSIATASKSTGSEQLLKHISLDQRPPHGRRVFVNRTLRMEKLQYIGFDLDWTLADYDQDAMAQLAFELTLQHMVEKLGYRREILQAEQRSAFLRRGLLIDIQEGTVLKMNRHRYVGRAYHGRSFLGPEERAALYRQEPINPTSDRFYIVDTLFELPEVNIFSELVELKKKGLDLPSYGQMFNDARAAMDTIHADDTLKTNILADLDRFLPKDPLLPLALKRLALHGRKLMLITNSEWFYTDALCRHLLDGCLPGQTSWREFFDLVVVLSKKPRFFRQPTPFVRLDETGKEQEEVQTPAWGGLYSGGSREGLMRLIDAPGEQVLYVGDHIYGDIVSSKLTSTWRTALIVRELEEELATRQELSTQQRHLEVLRAEVGELGQIMDDLRDSLTLHAELHPDANANLDQARHQLAEQRIEHKALRMHAKRLQSRISKAINPYWGSVFKQGGNKSLFGSQVNDYACLYTSRVSNLAYYGSHHYYRVLSDPMMHESAD
jgi:HAD superfamily 5'-nucleotidase-like hydrolase